MRKSMLTVLLITFLIIMAGCSFGKDLTNTPIKRVEAVLLKYQTKDKDVINDLNKVVAEDNNFNEKQRKLYIKMMKKHYSNMVYVIKDESIDGKEANVEVEIEVTDYSRILKEVEKYRQENESEFKDKNGNYDKSLYMDYKIKELMGAKETVKYILELTCSKKEGQWQVDNLSNTEKEKINGVYED